MNFVTPRSIRFENWTIIHAANYDMIETATSTGYLGLRWNISSSSVVVVAAVASGKVEVVLVAGSASALVAASATSGT